MPSPAHRASLCPPITQKVSEIRHSRLRLLVRNPLVLSGSAAWRTQFRQTSPRAGEGGEKNADPETLLALLAQACFMYGDVRATTDEAKLAAYDRGRLIAKRAVELAPKSAPAHFWYGTNTGRWGQTKGVMRSLFLLPTVKERDAAALDLDPAYAPAYALGGSIYYEVPGYRGRRPRPIRGPCSARGSSSIRTTPTCASASPERSSKKGRTADARREL